MTAGTVPDIIDHLAGLADGSPVAALRRQKPDLVQYAQASYLALLEPADPGDVSPIERHAIAYRVGILTGFQTVAAWHRSRLVELGAHDETIEAIAEHPDTLEPRLATLIAHTDRVTTAPGTAEPEHIEALKEAGLTPTGIVTVGQLIGFLGYQVRAIAVARAFAEES